MRIAVGRFWTESSSMSPLAANREMFQAGALVEGTQMLSFYQGTRTEVGGFLDVLARAGAMPVPLLGAHASCAGPLEQDFWEALRDRLLVLLAAAGPVDGVLLSLHGSTVSQRDDDLCGALLAGVRDQVGPGVPIVATLDMHGNPTTLMAASADALVAYKTYPHHDFVERGRQAAEIVLAAARGDAHPTVAVTTIPLRLESLELMNELIEQCVMFERDPDVLCASIMPTHPYLDVAEYHPLSAVVVTDGNHQRALEVGRRLMRDAWRQRGRTTAEAVRLVRLPEAIHEALAFPAGTVVMADRMDAVTGGFPGDSAEVIRHLLRLGVHEPACAIVTDPAFVRLAAGAGIGGTIAAPLGGKWGGPWYSAVEVTARIRLLSDGTLMKSREPRPGHLEVSNTTMGPTAVVQIAETITAVVTSVPVMSTEPTVYRSVGVEPTDYRIVVTKSVNQHRLHYPEAVGFIDLDAPGWGQSASSFQWQRRKPMRIYPIDDIPDDDVLQLLRCE